MDDVIKMLLVSPLFQGIPEGKMTEVLQCLDARWQTLKKDSSFSDRELL